MLEVCDAQAVRSRERDSSRTSTRWRSEDDMGSLLSVCIHRVRRFIQQDRNRQIGQNCVICGSRSSGELCGVLSAREKTRRLRARFDAVPRSGNSARRARRRCRWGRQRRVDPAAPFAPAVDAAAGSAKSSGPSTRSASCGRQTPSRSPHDRQAVRVMAPIRLPDLHAVPDICARSSNRQTHALQFRLHVAAGATFGRSVTKRWRSACLAACVQSNQLTSLSGNRRCCSSLASPHLVAHEHHRTPTTAA